MKDIKQNLVKMTKRNDVIVVVMLLYILIDIDMPDAVNDIVNSNMGAGVILFQ